MLGAFCQKQSFATELPVRFHSRVTTIFLRSHNLSHNLQVSSLMLNDKLFSPAYLFR